MQRILSILASLLAFICIAEIFAILISFIESRHVQTFPAHLAGFSIWVQLAWLVQYPAFSFTLNLPYPRTLTISLFVVVCLIFFIILAYQTGHRLPGAAGEYNVSSLVSLNCFICIVVDSLYLICTQFENWKKQLSSAQHQLQYRRIHHHFLFNTLNTTVCLISTHPTQAESNLINLSEMYRTMLQQNYAVSLNEEIKFAKRYIELETNRLGERLDVQWSVEPDVPLQIQLPAILLQPLIENAIYHGIEPSTQGGMVYISITPIDTGSLYFEIRNPVSEESPYISEGNQVAQSIIQERLSAFFDSNCSFKSQQIRNEYIVSFIVPHKEKV